MFEEILLQVRKPGRYIGQEWNVVKKDFDQSQVRFALCFPDLYEVGMSNLGIRIIYSILNSIPDVCCERFFSPAIDMENILRKNNLEIFSLESKKPLRSFDIIGFSLGYELSYSNVLNLLDLGRIPLKASSRDCTFPLVIAGGPCTLNPESMYEFFDFFVIGEAEEVILEIIDLYRKLKDRFKTSQVSKEELLILFSEIEGVYAPSLYEVKYFQDGSIEEFRPKFKNLPPRIKKRFIKDLDNTHFPLQWLVPYIEIVHDRLAIEVMRGCPNSCRFCQSRSLYFPHRFRNLKNALKLASQTYQHSGYEELSLVGLSVSDYPFLGRLLNDLVNLFKEKAVGVSLPSIKPKTLVANLASLIATIKKTGLTFAPEAATERLRRTLSKDFDEQIFFKALEEAYLSGYQRVKLYFMIGCPSEEENDLDSILDFSTYVSELRRKKNLSPAWVNISINALIPKPHTPFQWLAMEEINSLKSKIQYLKNKLKNKKIKLNFHDLKMSFLEAVLSRGDRRLSQIILSSFKKGARFDAWDDYFVFQYWSDSFLEFKIDPNFYLQEKSPDEFLPWDFLDIGISKDVLLGEYNKIIDIK